MYKKLNNELRRATDGVRKDWWKSECNELEELDKGARSDLMYKKVKTLTGLAEQSKKQKWRNQG